MVTPFGLVARCEHTNVEPGPGRLWASIEVQPRGKALEADRAPLAVALVIDVSSSMQGDPLAHVLTSCGLVADLLSARDQLAIITFGTDAGVRCGLTTVDDAGRAQVRDRLRGVTAHGNTNMHGGIEVAAGVLMTAAPGLRRVMVVLSDGQPNIGLRTAHELGAYVRSLKLAVSSLGFGLHHDENVLDAIATAGSGRYAYIADPSLARVDLARAALAHGGIVADHLELKLSPAEGVEVMRLLPVSPLRVGGGGLTTAIGDVFIDEGRAFAVELGFDLSKHASGRLLEIAVEGKAPDGSAHRVTATLKVDVRAGTRGVDKAAQAAIILVQADAARAEARAQSDRGAMPAAAALIRQIAARIDAIDGFVKNDGSVLAELREQLEDEAANYERKSTDMERMHQRKASMQYKSATPVYTQAGPMPAPVRAALLGIGGPVVGKSFDLLSDNRVGRSPANEIPVASGSLSRVHARVVFVDGVFRLQDMGSTYGSEVNGSMVHSAKLSDGDLVKLGDAVFRFRLQQP